MVGDHQRLKQILFKLMMNAANFAPEGSVIELECTRDDGDVVFRVSDNGPGVPEDMRETLFSRFATGSQSGRKRGAGLGLSIVESFVGLHHGTVGIENRQEGGATVTCRFPLDPQVSRDAAE